MIQNKIIIDPNLTKTFQNRFPRSKKKRIQKKWRNNHANYVTVPDPNYYVLGDKILCHPEMATRLEKEIRAQYYKNKVNRNAFFNGIM